MMHTGTAANVHFQDGQAVVRKSEVKYLGCYLNQDCDTKRELNQRISNCMAIMKKMDLFWRHSDCPVRLKLTTLDAVIRSKLLYGLDAVNLKEPEKKRLDAFQLKGLRKIMHMQTTFVNRQNTNQKVYETVNNKLEEEGARKPLKQFREMYKEACTKRAARTLKASPSDQARRITFETDSIRPRAFGNKKVGRPKQQWAETATRDLWDTLQPMMQHPFCQTPLDFNDTRHKDQLLKTLDEEQVRGNKHRSTHQQKWQTRRLQPHELMFSNADAGLHIR
jgi:hypothetical protein